jgi:transcriptional regulator with XRE-family HTH domain
MKNSVKDARKKLGERVRELRKSAELTQEALGELAELNYKFIGELERGRVNVSLDAIVRIAAALRVKIGDLFSKEKVPLQKVIVKEKNPPQFSPQDLHLIKKALQLLNRTFSKV